MTDETQATSPRLPDQEALRFTDHLTFCTNYNVCLFNFVDRLSMWSSFIHPDMRDHFTTNYDLTEEDQKWLLLYSKARSKLDWKETADLFDWSFNNFPPSDKYQELLRCIRYFESRKNHEGVSLKEEVEQALPKVLASEEKIKTIPSSLDPTEIILKAEALFDRAGQHERSIPCYLMFSPTQGLQAGANGEAISIELPLKQSDPGKRASLIIPHEFFHIILRPKIFLRERMGEEAHKFYTQIIPNLYQIELASFFDEAIIHTLSDVLLVGESVEETLERFQQRQAKGELGDHNIRYLRRWQAVVILKPIFEDYLSGKLSIEETRQRIFETSKLFIEDFSNKHS